MSQGRPLPQETRMFLAVHEMRRRLDAKGYAEIDLRDKPGICPSCETRSLATPVQTHEKDGIYLRVFCHACGWSGRQLKVRLDAKTPHQTRQADAGATTQSAETR